MWGSSDRENVQCLGGKDTASHLPQAASSNQKLYNALKFQTSTINESPFFHVICSRGRTVVAQGDKKCMGEESETTAATGDQKTNITITSDLL